MALSVKYLGKSLSWRLIPKKNRPEKCPFIATNNWIVLCIMYCIKYSDSLLNVFLLRKIPVIPEKWWRKKEEKENSGILQIFYALRLTFKLALSFSRRIKLHQHLTKLINLAKINISPSHEKREKIKTLHSFWIENISVIVFFFARQIFISVTDFWS